MTARNPSPLRRRIFLDHVGFQGPPEFINAKQRRSGKPCIIYYIGDYDPAGVLIDKQIEKELREHLSDDVDLEFDRIAVLLNRYSVTLCLGSP